MKDGNYMSRFLIIGIHGPARAGKDTAADLILAENPNMRKLRFADPIKLGCAAMLGMDVSRMSEGDREALIPGLHFSIRKILQVMGTEGGRSVHPDMWVNLARRNMEALKFAGCEGVVIPDVRFQNEIDFIREDGYMIHIRRDTEEVGVEGHVSEAGLGALPNEFIIHNDKSLEEFLAQVYDDMESIKELTNAKQ